MFGHMYTEMACGQSSRENYTSPIASSEIHKKTQSNYKKTDLKVGKKKF
jgi:hypothetical protein